MPRTSPTRSPARPSAIAARNELRAEAVEWLASKGLDQWQPGQPRVPTRETTADAIARGACYLAYDQDGELVGTITVDDRADPEFWTPAERSQPALYVHRIIVRRQLAGRGVGRLLLDWAAGRASASGYPWLRLDAWKSNQALHRYYHELGFRHVRTVDLKHRGSGARFQRSARTEISPLPAT
jgi:GNAT superfamily N-acetyltransferase